MNYIKLTIPCNESQSDILIALLSDKGYEGFETSDLHLLAYINEMDFDAVLLKEVLVNQNVNAEISHIEKKNWNEEWERNFQPVIVDDFCVVRADFHSLEAATMHEIIINPKMSFGTGHHATTQLMIEAMREIPFSGKTVLDFGTGTGILAILASKLGAESIVAIDTEDWSCENAIENATRNTVSAISVRVGSLENVTESGFDCILANINRHILLKYMAEMHQKLKVGGVLLLSGILEEDVMVVQNAASENGLKFLDLRTKENWIALKFQK